LGTFEAMLDTLVPKGSVDLAFIDASGPPQDAYMRARHAMMALDHLAEGGIVMMDDMAATDWPLVNVLRGLSNLYIPTMRGQAIFQKRSK